MITDDQIREFRLALAREMEGLLPRARVAQANAIGANISRAWEDAWEEFKLCDVALGRIRNSRRERGGKAAARARLAEILTARGLS